MREPSVEITEITDSCWLVLLQNRWPIQELKEGVWWCVVPDSGWVFRAV